MAWWIALLVGCGGGPAEIPTAVAEQGAFDVRLEVKGELEAKSSAVVTCPDFDVNTKIAWVVEEGTRVKKGDKVVEFDTAEMVTQLENAQAALEIARTKIEQNQAQLALKVADAEAQITQAELDLRLARMRVTDSETVPLVEREDAKANAIRGEMAIDAAKSALETTRLQARAEQQLLQLEVEKQGRDVARLERQLEQAVLTAPTDGLAILYERWDGKIKVGTQPWSGSTLVTLPDLATMEAVVWVHEVDSPQVAKDQAAVVLLDAHPNSPVEATVGKVADLAVPRGEDEIKHLKVTLTLAETTEVMKPGMTVQADLVVDRVQDAVSVPLEAVHRADGATFVYVSGVAGWARKDVVLGPESDTRVVITEGVAGGDVVALVDPTAWTGESSADTSKKPDGDGAPAL